MIELNDVIVKASKQNKSIIGVNGDDILTISSEKRFFQDIWNSSLKTKTACVLDLKGHNPYGILSQISNKITQSKILIILTKPRTFIYSNDFKISRILNSKVLLKFLKEKDKIDSSLYIDAIRMVTEFDRFIEGKKLVVVICLPLKYVSLISKNHLISIISLLKKLSPHEYLRHYSLKQCVICKSPSNPKGVEIFKNSFFINQYFNLPICHTHEVDYFKIAMELRNNTFDIDSFTKNIKSYLKSSVHKCIVCEKEKKRVISSPYCSNCLKNFANYFIEVALDLVDPMKLSDSHVRLLKCPDCGTSIEREGMCNECERHYSWRHISRDLDNGDLIWDNFISNISIRRNYRVVRRE